MISIIAAVSSGNVLGNEQGLPWRGQMPNELDYFRRQTQDKIIVMGSTTYKEFSKPLPKRRNIVLSRSTPDDAPDGFEFFNSIDDVLQLNTDGSELMIVGGGQIYRLFLPYADKIYLTRIQANFSGEVNFPKLDPAEWECQQSTTELKDQNNQYDAIYEIYTRI